MLFYIAHFNTNAMSGAFIVDTWLDTIGAYDEDAGASEFYQAAEMAANPILTVANELLRRFRMWVETLTIGTNDRPLQDLLNKNGKVLCFNYTEFIETLYGFPEQSVCYIHGCRRKKKYFPKEKLILGHSPQEDIFSSNYDYDDKFLRGIKEPYRLSMIDAARDNVIRLISEGDEALTKECSDIIRAQDAFFASLDKIEDIVTIGHSLSHIDGDYFREIIARIPNIKDVHWYFGCHGLGDLNNLKKLLVKLGIDKSAVSVFRTDNVAVTYLEDKASPKATKKSQNKKRLCTSSDGKWLAETLDRSFLIIDRESHTVDYEVLFPSYVAKAFFDSSCKFLFAITYGIGQGVFLFRVIDNHWSFINELESIPNQNLINRRLHSVFMTTQEITFVYNNRVRKYSLADGALVSNIALRGAKDRVYEGENVSQFFIERV